MLQELTTFVTEWWLVLAIGSCITTMIALRTA